MNAVPSWYRALLGPFDLFLKYGLVVFFTSAALLYLTQIGLRMAHRSVLWLDPLVQYLFVMGALFGAAYGVKTGESIKIEIFRKLASRRAPRVLLNLTASVISGFMTAAFILRFKEDWVRGEASDFLVPRWLLNIPYILLFLITVVYYSGRAFFPSMDVAGESHTGAVEPGAKQGGT